MSWLDRLQSTIQLTSPNGNVFNPKWRGNERSREKKLGLFTYPDVAGTISQDLNVNSTKWPLVLYFDGSDYDIDAGKFFDATAETGLWEVVHPTKGTIELQLVSVTEPIQPIESGNVSQVSVDFIEPADVSVIKSSSELQNEIGSSIIDSNLAALASFSDSVTGAIGNAANAVNTATKKVRTVLNEVLKPLAEIDEAVNSAFNSIDRGIQDTISDATAAPAELAGQIQNIIQLPAKISVSATRKLNIYYDLMTGVNSSISGDTKETFAIKDLVLSSVLASVTDVSSFTDAKTRQEIIKQVELVSSIFNTITDQLDNDTDLVETTKIENQYISQEGSYPQNLKMSALAINYLLRFSLDLSVEKKITLKDYTLPIMLTIKEYGTDELLDFFNETNEITNEEFLLLSPGREIVIYPGVIL